MKPTKQQWLELRLNLIFKFHTQIELGEMLKIGQWKLLEKMKNKSFTDEEILKIEEITNKIIS